MLTVRVDRQNGRGDWIVHECVRYGVTMLSHEVRIVLQLALGPAAGSLPPETTLSIGPGEVAYVLNDRGDTIDTIRVPAPRAVAGAR